VSALWGAPSSQPIVPKDHAILRRGVRCRVLVTRLAVAAGAGWPSQLARIIPLPLLLMLDRSLLVRRARRVRSPSAAEFARQVPRLRRYFLNGMDPTVYLPMGRAAPPPADARDILAGRVLSNAAVRVVEGRYGWRQLDRWQEGATVEALRRPRRGVRDNDETSNRVRIGVGPGRDRAGSRPRWRAGGIPDEAVIVERVEPIKMVQAATSLQGRDRPVRAGVQINFPGFLCSVGFNATSGTQSPFVTASHCTNTQGAWRTPPIGAASVGGPDPDRYRGG